MLRCLLCLLISCVYVMSTRLEANTLDRLILEIDGKSFTQRQIEVYQALRCLAMGSMTSKALPGPEGWVEALESFRNEHVIFVNIENNIEKMDTLQPDHRSIRRVLEQLETLKGTNFKWRDFVRAYHLNEKELLATLFRIYQIQAHLQGLAHPGLPGQLGSTHFIVIDPEAEWFKVLFQSAAVRYYDKAREYTPIQPLGG